MSDEASFFLNKQNESNSIGQPINLVLLFPFYQKQGLNCSQQEMVLPQRRGAKSFGSSGPKKQKIFNTPDHSEDADQIPKSFVFKYGKVTRSLGQLSKELRQIMEPNTATKLKEHKLNKLKDYLSVAGQLDVTHFLYLMQNTTGISHARFFRFPHGPTLSFRIPAYSLCEDVQRMHRSTRHPTPNELIHPPIVIFSNFDAKFGRQVGLVKTFLQNMFPSISPEKIGLNACKRVVLFHYDNENELVLLRHYLVVVRNGTVTKELEELLWKGKIPDLHELDDISEYLATNTAQELNDQQEGSAENESLLQENTKEEEEEEGEEVSLTDNVIAEEQSIGSAVERKTQRKVQLIEVGPRLSLELIRIQQESSESSTSSGTILYDKINNII